MDKAGRRPLLLYPMIAMIFILALITAAITLQVKYKILSVYGSRGLWYNCEEKALTIFAMMVSLKYR